VFLRGENNLTQKEQRHGATYAKHALACAAALKTIIKGC
jgi:adenosylmethionine-8-amino-7-oxononanoate aminotransferase